MWVIILTSAGKNHFPIVSQTQTWINNVYADFDDKESPITRSSEEPEFSEIPTQLNSAFKDTDDYLIADLNVIINHIYLAGVNKF